MVIKDVSLAEVWGYTTRPVQHELPEIAFAGKSNVGKSSLINALMNRKSLARTSAQPGKTQTINFYKINGAFFYTDLPGYGYARVSAEEKAKWGKMIERYLKFSASLRHVFLLVDIRHEPSENDRLMLEWIRSNGYQPDIIATKLDKINRSQLQKQTKQIRASLGLLKEEKIFPFSALTKQGREEIWAEIDRLLEDARQESLAAEEK